ncbi:Uncharacterized protein SCF082_LOCUS14853 [Durusdinium trenchii]|uniref:Uncharacterized protein n=1 Tax=Durusdinium trenchii TaxID=1381693 RepID=A0ABP0K1E9_9DINO
MTHHVDEMAREIASMEVLGPNPRAGLRYAVNLASKAAAEGEADVRTPFDTLTPGRAPDGLESRVRSQARLAERMFALHSGEAYAAVDGKLARVLGDAVNVTVSTKLGAAFLSAVSDPVFKKLSRAFNGMPEAGAVRSTVRMLTPGIAGDRAVAVRSGLIAEGAAQVMQGQARYIGDFAAHAWSRRLADVTLRWSLLSPWTQAGKWSSGMELMGFMGDLVRQRQGWTQLHRDVRAMLERHGFDESDWAVLRGAELYAPRDGVSLLRPEEIERVQVGEPGRAETLARRFLEMVHVEMAFGTPSASYRGQAAFFGASGRGTFLDAIIRSVSLFNSFPVTVFHLTTARLMQRAMSLQLKEIAKGRAPKRLVGHRAGVAALMQGGAMSLQLKEIAKGRDPRPMADEGGEVINLTAGNALQLAQGEDTNAGAELSSFVRNNTPGGSIWYLRLAFERLLMDEVERAVNPDAHSRWRRLQRRYQRDYDQEYWWRPGEASPDRLPDASAALSQPER